MRSLRIAVPFAAPLLVLPGLAQTAHWDQGSSFSTGTFGHALDVAGDMDGDGLDDVVVGDFDASPVVFHDGQVQGLSGLDGSILWTYDGLAALESVGFDVAGVGDLNGDGRADVVATAVAGAPVLISGSSGLSVFTFTSQGMDQARVVRSAGDVNADGVPDVVLGGSGFNGTTGRAWVVSGAYLKSGSGPELLHVLDGPVAGGSFAQALDGAGDVDGDGRDDIIVSSPGESGVQGIFLYNGVVRVFSGADGSLIRMRRYFGPFSAYGRSVAGLGDLDGDGRSEVAVGAPNHDSQAFTDVGAAWVIDGADGSTRHLLVGNSPGDFLGFSLAAAGDMTGDGVPDFLVGRIGEGVGGRVRLHSGVTGSSVGVLQEQAGSFGWDLAGGADFDGDDQADCLTSAPGQGASGQVYAYLGDCLGGNQPSCSALANSFSALGGLLTASGSTSIAANALSLIARDCPPGNQGVFFVGEELTQVPFGDGFLCVTGNVKRLLPGALIDAQGQASFALDLSSAPFGAALLPGDTRLLQFWFRDPGGPGGSGFNLTNARQLTFCP